MARPQIGPVFAMVGAMACRRGNAAVEFALLAPIFLTLLLGTLVFGIYFGVVHSVQQLASEAARAAVAGVTEAERRTLARHQVDTSLASYGLLNPRALAVTAAFDPADPSLFRVTLVYDASGLGLNVFTPLLPTASTLIQRSAAVRRGGA